MLNMELPMAYMWDDHDFGPDNSDATAPGRDASLRAYREYVPHYPLQDKYQNHYFTTAILVFLFLILSRTGWVSRLVQFNRHLRLDVFAFS
jgi:hypothetical protein